MLLPSSYTFSSSDPAGEEERAGSICSCRRYDEGWNFYSKQHADFIKFDLNCRIYQDIPLNSYCVTLFRVDAPARFSVCKEHVHNLMVWPPVFLASLAIFLVIPALMSASTQKTTLLGVYTVWR